MTFTESITTCFSKYATFSGRASRSEYWWFFLFNLLINLVIAGLAHKLFIIYALATFLPCLAVGIRRLHDTDRSGWWMLIAFLPAIGGLILLIMMVLDSKEPNRFG